MHGHKRSLEMVLIIKQCLGSTIAINDLVYFLGLVTSRFLFCWKKRAANLRLFSLQKVFCCHFLEGGFNLSLNASALLNFFPQGTLFPVNFLMCFKIGISCK